MEITSAWSITKDTKEAVNTAFREIKNKSLHEPNLIFLYCSVEYDVKTILKEINALAPNVSIQGGTSCLGVMTESGFHSKDGLGLGLLGIHDPDGHYGVGAEKISGDAKLAAKQAINIALEKCDCPGQVPSMVWVTAAPGNEEDVILGIQEVIGENVPITGGSSADNTVSGKWLQIADQELFNNAVVLTVMFPSTNVISAFHSGYEPTEKFGIVTKSNGRIVSEIDNKPAAQVYNDWSNNLIGDFIHKDGNILSITSLHPLGRIVGTVNSVPYYQLAHPDSVTSDGSISLFANIEEGEKLVYMSGTKDGLVNRAGRVAQASLTVHSTHPNQISGAIVVYCAGCMLTVQDRMEDVVSGLKTALNNKPFLGIFTFGEQGCFVGGENRHGNLMISVMTFTQ